MKQISILLNTYYRRAGIFVLLSVWPAGASRPGARRHRRTAHPRGQSPRATACDPWPRTAPCRSAARRCINVVPDRALIQLGVQSNGVTPDAVKQANSAAIQKVIKAAARAGR